MIVKQEEDELPQKSEELPQIKLTLNPMFIVRCLVNIAVSLYKTQNNLEEAKKIINNEKETKI